MQIYILFIADLLQQVAGLEPFGGTLSAMVESTHFSKQTAGYELIHLVNGTAHFGVNFFAPVTLVDPTMIVPYPHQPVSVRSLHTGEGCTHA